jgi:hypothetical protein
MGWIAAVAMLGASLAGDAALAQTALAPEQAELLAAARAEALRYSQSLPDFICTQIVRRNQKPHAKANWAPLDTLTVKLSYFGHKEDYHLMAIDGRATRMEYANVIGAVSTGEFGTNLLSIFLPDSAAVFEWKGTARVRKHSVARFGYRVPKETSAFHLQYGGLSFGRRVLTVAYHGEIAVDWESHLVMRLSKEAEIPSGFPITANSSQIDYDYAPIGGKAFLLPVSAHVVTHSGTYTADNKVEFRDYGKFHAESTIHFGGEGESETAGEKK